MADLKSEKTVWLNKLRQVNPHWEPSKSFNLKKGYGPEADKHDGDIHHEENKELNEYYNKTWSNAQEVMAQQIDEEMNPSKYKENDIEQTKRAIIDKILKHFDDALFEMVSEEMSKKIIFTSRHYLTDEGFEIFEDEWFEFYHEHHGDILASIHNKLIY